MVYDVVKVVAGKWFGKVKEYDNNSSYSAKPIKNLKVRLRTQIVVVHLILRLIIN
jgi:hypothetical protein